MSPPEALIPPIRARWSPRAFASRPLEPAELRLIFEAARWAPSGGNRQPWRFLVATREEPESFAELVACLDPGNQRWAPAAAALIVTLVESTRERAGVRVPNPLALYDLGLAMGQLGVQATALGLHLHHMGGFLPERVQERCQVPAPYVPMTMVAVGVLGDPDTLPADLAERERAPRARLPLSGIVSGVRFGEPPRWARAEPT